MIRPRIAIFLIIMAFITACAERSEDLGTGGADGVAVPAGIVVPMFQGEDQSGATFSTDAVKGRPWIASFFFTSCTTVCPDLNRVQADLHAQYSDRLSFVSISTDPERDTVGALAAYAQQYGAVPGSWWMIRMPLDSVRQLSTEGFALMDPKTPDMHSTRLVAVNADMTIAGYFDSTDSTHLARLRTWINSLPSTQR